MELSSKARDEACAVEVDQTLLEEAACDVVFVCVELVAVVVLLDVLAPARMLRLVPKVPTADIFNPPPNPQS
jgi:prephenate dehydrogenase